MTKKNHSLDDDTNTNNREIKLHDNFNRQVLEMTKLAQQASRLYIPVFKTEIPRIFNATSQLAETVRSSQIAISKAMAKLTESGVLTATQKIADSFAEITRGLKAHFPDNWPPGEMKKCDDLCMQGIPIIFIPRSDIVTKMVRAKNITGIKQVIVRNDNNIIDDCEKAVSESSWLSRDMREQIIESIDSYKNKRYRAAQSTATVAFDCLLNEIIDIRLWRRANNNSKALSHGKVKQLTDEFAGNLMELPLSRAPFYTLLMFPVIGQMLAVFEIGDKTSYKNDFNRHMSAHTVSARQYKRSNALMAVMTLASICKVTELRGKNWMQISAKEYGVGL